MKFEDLKRPEDSILMVVDALNLAFRYKHSKKRDFGADYIRTIQSLAQSYSCGKIVIASDLGHSSFRRAIYPGYKAGRKEKYDAQSDEEKNDFLEFFDDYEKTLEMLRSLYPVFRFQNVEADDIAAYIVNRHSKKYEHIWLISSDKDWDLLIQDNVSRFSYVTRKETTVDTWCEHYDFPLDSYVTVKCLMGDTGDSIKGIEGIGPKRAAEVVKQYGGLFDILDSIPLPGKSKFIQKLNEGKELLNLNFQLVDLRTFCEDAIGPDNIKVIEYELAAL